MSKVNEIIEKGTKERIRDVAIDLFSQQGYNAVSIREIARAVGIKESSIYSHYKGKEDIMNTIIQFLISESARTPSNEIPLETLIDKFSPQEFVNFTSRMIMEQLKKPSIRKISRLMCIELFRNEKIQDFFRNTFIALSYKQWEEIFQKLMDLGSIKKYNARILAEEFFNYCLYLYFDCFIIHYEEAEFDKLIDSMVVKLSKHIQFMFDVIGKEHN